MSYHLYNRLGSGGFVVEAALTLAKVDFELTELDSKVGTPLPESFRETNPWGQVPTLILPDGTTMTESTAILIHLAACFPEKALAPAPGTSEHAQFLRWTVFAGVNLYGSVVRRGYPFRFTDDEEGHKAIRNAAIRRMGEALLVIEDHIKGPFLLGENMSLADIYIAMFFIWNRGEIEAPKLFALTNQVRSDRVIGPIWRRHFGER